MCPARHYLRASGDSDENLPLREHQQSLPPAPPLRHGFFEASPRIRRLLDSFDERAPLWILAGAFVLRLAALAVVDRFTGAIGQGFNTQASLEFAQIAANIVNGVGFSYQQVQGVWVPSAYMPPAYAYFLAGLFLLFGTQSTASFVVAQCVNVAVGSLTCLLIYRLGALWFTRKVGILAGWIAAAGYPTFVYMVVVPHSVTLYVALNCLLALILSSSKLDARRASLAGAVAGVLLLFRPETLLYYPVLMLMVLLKMGIRRSAFPIALFFLVLALVVTPWTVRNYLVLGHATPMTSLGGFNLWRGQNERATGAGRGPGSEWVTPELQRRFDSLPPTHDFEFRKDDIYRDEAVAFIKQHPMRSLALVPRKLFFYWVLEINDPRTHRPEYWVPWALLAPFFLLGCARSWYWRPRPWIAYIYLVASSVLVSVFFVLTRYRMFVDPFIFILAALGLVVVWERLRGQGIGRASALARPPQRPGQPTEGSR